jgi:hypothetical protein
MLGERDFDKRAEGVNAKLEDGLHGDLDSVRELKRETPVHRTMINMSAAGYQNVEIAKFLGRNIATVSNTLKQPWAREYLLKEAKKTVQDEIKQLLESEALPSIKKLIAIRDSVDLNSGIPVLPADKNVSAQAANSILDRFLGKPTQPITTEAKPTAQLSDEELRQQLLAEMSANKPN